MITVSLRMTGLMERFLPDGAVNNTATVRIPEHSTVAALIERLGVPGEQSCLVVVNDETVPKARRMDRVLADGDAIAIVPPLKGG